MSFLLPMGLSPSGNWDCHALGMETIGSLGGLAYNSETFLVEIGIGPMIGQRA